MSELTIEDFTRLVVQKIEELELNVLLNNPDTEAKYPCVVVGDVYSNIKHSNDLTPLFSQLQISIEVWDTKKYSVMSLLNDITVKLRELNISTNGNISFLFDEITNKHRGIMVFDVFYNGLTNALEPTKN